MLSLRFPEIMGFLKDAGPGLWPLKRSDLDRFVLLIKGSAELALVAKARKEIKFHIYDLSSDGETSTGVITALYDRENNPIVVRTVCGDPFNRDLMVALQSQEMDISFFDSHNSELFSGVWSLSTSSDFPNFISQPISIEPGSKKFLPLYVEINNRFAALDDGFVVTGVLTKSEQVENVHFMHVTNEHVLSERAEGLGIYSSQLEVKDSPGPSHEAEIARLLAGRFGGDRVIVGPQMGNREFCDILVLDEKAVLCFQAKSSLREETRLTESETKKRNRNSKHFDKALRQVSGSERAFYTRREPISYGPATLAISPDSTLLVHVIVLSEKDPRDLATWSKSLKPLTDRGVFVVVLDTAEFTSLISVCKSPDEMLSILCTIDDSYSDAVEIGKYLFHSSGIAIQRLQ